MISRPKWFLSNTHYEMEATLYYTEFGIGSVIMILSKPQIRED